MYLHTCVCIYIYIYMYACFFRWIFIFAYAGEMEEWAKFRCNRSAFQIAWITSTHLWFTYYWNWKCDYLLCPSAAPRVVQFVPRTLITGQFARLWNSSTNFCTAPSQIVWQFWWPGCFKDHSQIQNPGLFIHFILGTTLALFVLAVSQPGSCRMLQMQAAVCSVGRGPGVTTLYSAATHRQRCWKREVASIFSAFGNQIWLTWSSMRYFQQEVHVYRWGFTDRHSKTYV